MSAVQASVEPVAGGLWTLRYPVSLFGARIGRTVTVIRLRSGELIIHSTAPFSEADVAAIHALGRPSWLVEANLFHETFARDGRNAFPVIPYLVPDGFHVRSGATGSLGTPPAAWAPEVEVLPLEGMLRLNEHALLHRPTRTLVVADLVFNFGSSDSTWTRWMFRRIGGVRAFPGVSRLFRSMIRDRAAFARSARELMRRDFDRLIVGHGDVIESGARVKLGGAFAAVGFDV